MRLITDNDRTYILAQLTNASDEVLVRAYQDWDAQRAAAVEVRAKICQSDYKVSEQKTETLPREAPTSVERANVSPGPSSISKIGGTTKAEIMNYLDNNKKPPGKYQEHLKLLWSRGEVKFDGEEWYA